MDDTDGFEDWAVRWIMRVLVTVVCFWLTYWVSQIIPDGFLPLMFLLIVRARWKIVDEDGDINWDKELRTLTRTGRL